MFAEFKRRSQHTLPAITTSIAFLLSTTALSYAAGLPYGATKEDFIAALADMDPVELVMQVTGSPGDENSLASEQYAAAVTEWSGGKIQGKVVYGNAILAGNTAPAVADGRITFGGVIAQYDPSNFPISAGLVDLSFVSNSSPIAGALQTWGTLMEASGTEEAIEEQRDYGVEPLFIQGGTTASGLFCSEPRNDVAKLAGVQTRAGGLIHGREVDALGASAVSLPYSEMFEGLQRGIIGCALTSITTAKVAGIIPLAPYHALAPANTGFGLTTTNMAFDIVFWEEIPLEARQLLWDLSKAYIRQTILASWKQTQVGLQDIADAGGEVLELSPDAAERLAAENSKVLEEMRSFQYFGDGNAVVEGFLAASDKWEAIVAELGYAELDPGWANFGAWYEPGKVDIDPFVDRLFEEILLPNRPE